MGKWLVPESIVVFLFLAATFHRANRPAAGNFYRGPCNSKGTIGRRRCMILYVGIGAAGIGV
jgi:hypothetical protein